MEEFQLDSREGVGRAIARSAQQLLRWQGLVYVLVAIGACLRLSEFWRPIRIDEAWTALDIIDRSLLEIAVYYDTNNNHIFFSLLAKLSIMLFGSAEPWVVRLPALVAGILVVPLTYLAARLWFERGISLLATTFVAVFPVLISYSANARGYSFATVMLLCLMILAHRNFRKPTRRAGVLLAIVLTFGMWTHPTFLYWAGAVLLWLFVSLLLEDVSWVGFRKSIVVVLWPAMLTSVSVLLLYLPIFIDRGDMSGVVISSDLPRSTLLDQLLPAATNTIGYLFQDVSVLSFGLLIAAFSISLLTSPKPLGLRLFWLCVVAWGATTTMFVGDYPPARTIQLVLPIFLIGAAAGFASFANPSRRSQAIGGSLFLIIIGISLLAWKSSGSWVIRGERTMPDDATVVARFVQERLRSGDLVRAFSGVLKPVSYHIRLSDPASHELLNAGLDDFWAATPSKTLQRILLIFRPEQTSIQNALLRPGSEHGDFDLDDFVIEGRMETERTTALILQPLVVRGDPDAV